MDVHLQNWRLKGGLKGGCKRLHDSILSIISVSSTFASLNLNR